MNNLVLLGSADSVFSPDYKDKSIDIWAAQSVLSKTCPDVKRVNLGFELHSPEVIQDGINKRTMQYNKFDCKIMVQDEQNEVIKKHIKKPVTFPLAEVRKYAGKDYFTSTFCYMVIYAAMLGYKDISLFKILLTAGSEYMFERPGLEYWIEKLSKTENISFHIPEDCELFQGNQLYAYDDKTNFKLQSRKKHLWARFTNEFKFIEQKTAAINKAMGFMDCYRFIQQNPTEEDLKKQIEQCRATAIQAITECEDHKEKYLLYAGALQELGYTEDREG